MAFLADSAGPCGFSLELNFMMPPFEPSKLFWIPLSASEANNSFEKAKAATAKADFLSNWRRSIV